MAPGGGPDRAGHGQHPWQGLGPEHAAPPSFPALQKPPADPASRRGSGGRGCSGSADERVHERGAWDREPGGGARCFSVPFCLQAELSILILCFHARSSERQTPLLGGPGEEWESGNVGPGWGGGVELLTGGSRHPGGQDTGSGIASRFLNCSSVLRKARDAAHLFRRKCAALGPSPGRRHMGVSWPLGEAPGLAPPSPELPGRPSLHAQGDAPGGPEGVRPPRVRGRRWWLPLTRPPGTSAQ